MSVLFVVGLKVPLFIFGQETKFITYYQVTVSGEGRDFTRLQQVKGVSFFTGLVDPVVPFLWHRL